MKKLGFILLGIGCLPTPVTVFALTYDGDYHVNANSIAYKKMRMTPTSNDPTWTNIVSVGGTINGNTSQQSVKLNAGINGTTHDRVNAERSYVTQSSLGLDYSHSQPRSQFFLRGTYQSDANALQDPAKIDFTGGNESRMALNVQPSIMLSISELTTATLYGSASEHRFSRSSGLNYQDYDDVTAGMSVTRIWTTRLSTSLTSNVGRFRPMSGLYSTYNVQSQMSSRYALSQQSNADASVGVFRKSNSIANNYDDGWLARININTAWWRSRFNIDISRQLSPTGFGIVSTNDRIMFSADHSLDSTLSVGLSAQQIRTHNSGILGTNRDLTYLAMTFSLSKLLTPQWRTSFATTAIRQEYGENYISSDDIQARWEIGYAGKFLLN